MGKILDPTGQPIPIRTPLEKGKPKQERTLAAASDRAREQDDRLRNAGKQIERLQARLTLLCVDHIDQLRAFDDPFMLMAAVSVVARNRIAIPEGTTDEDDAKIKASFGWQAWKRLHDQLESLAEKGGAS